MNRLIVLVTLALASLQACASTHTPPSTPVVLPPAVPIVPPPTAVQAPKPYDGHVRFMSNWLLPAAVDLAAPDPTASFTNAQMLTMDCDDPQTADRVLRERAGADGRAIVLHAGLMGWGNEGYQVVDEAALATCWGLERQFIRDYRSRVLEVHTADEPPDVAWSHWDDGGTRYNPNRYNADLSTICTTVHADFPDLPCAVDYGSVPDGLVVASGIDHVWLETYDADWHTKLDKIAALTADPLTLMPPGSVAGDPAALDQEKANLVLAEWTEAQANPRIVSLVFFLWCCDDVVTGDRNFYTVSGGRLPLTLAALQAVGTTIKR